MKRLLVAVSFSEKWRSSNTNVRWSRQTEQLTRIATKRITKSSCVVMTVHISKALRVSNLLTEYDDKEIREFVDTGVQLGICIGCETENVRFADDTIFVKLQPLAEAEESDPTSSAGQLQLPFISHWGIGCPSAGAG